MRTETHEHEYEHQDEHSGSARRGELLERFAHVRAATEALAEPLSAEDQQIQAMPEASPTKWHRAHTTWFFEKFLLEPAGVAAYDNAFDRLFNSYYDAVGDRVARDKRGLLSRPSAEEVGVYRRVVDGRVAHLLQLVAEPTLKKLAPIVELGLAHEEQHQELILTDILAAFFESPLQPAYLDDAAVVAPLPAPSSIHAVPPPLSWRSFEGGVRIVGDDGAGFAFDNERPRHRVFLEDYALASRVVNVGEMRAFIEAGGYETPSLWLSDGFAIAQAQKWRAPRYATCDGDGEYRVFTLHGWRTANDHEAARHLSFWEADAVARFLDARLPTEQEWEAAMVRTPSHERNAGDVWEWTRSSYEPYPGFRPAAGALGEYNGKFMAQQMVLRGGSSFTPRGHASRTTYRNFWHPSTRFQASGVRLARDE